MALCDVEVPKKSPLRNSAIGTSRGSSAPTKKKVKLYAIVVALLSEAEVRNKETVTVFLPPVQVSSRLSNCWGALLVNQ